MSLFDSKEEVMEIALTAEGKKALSNNVFKPVFYYFSDDGVMYNIKEYIPQADIQAKIKSEICHKFLDKHFVEIGSYSCSKNAPSWKLNFIDTTKQNISYYKNEAGIFTSSVNVIYVPFEKYYKTGTVSWLGFTTSDYKAVKKLDSEIFIEEYIPQITSKIKTKILFNEEKQEVWFSYKDKKIFCEVEELNSFFSDEFQDFELQVYEYIIDPIDKTKITTKKLGEEEIIDKFNISVDQMIPKDKEMNKNIYGEKILEADNDKC